MSEAQEAAERLLRHVTCGKSCAYRAERSSADTEIVARSLSAAEQRAAELEQENARLRAALDETRRYALVVVGASEAYGETESAHLWQEIAEIADKALWPLSAPTAAAGE